ncbi:hypothetical protein VTO73DRAFT_11100 [Trametes versicolor]
MEPPTSTTLFQRRHRCTGRSRLSRDVLPSALFACISSFPRSDAFSLPRPGYLLAEDSARSTVLASVFSTDLKLL